MSPRLLAAALLPPLLLLLPQWSLPLVLQAALQTLLVWVSRQRLLVRVSRATHPLLAAPAGRCQQQQGLVQGVWGRRHCCPAVQLRRRQTVLAQQQAAGPADRLVVPLPRQQQGLRQEEAGEAADPLLLQRW